MTHASVCLTSSAVVTVPPAAALHQPPTFTNSFPGSIYTNMNTSPHQDGVGTLAPLPINTDET